MKIVVLADIHGNLQALHAVCDHVDRWDPDAVLVAGDIVNRGTRSPACYDLIQERRARDGWLVVRGNHEEYVINRGAAGASVLSEEYNVFGAVDWTCRALGHRAAELSDLPTERRFATEVGEVFLTHGSLLGSRDGIYPHTTDEELLAKVSVESVAFAVGHTHRPLTRWCGRCLVINAGSVGIPFDGDTRPAYARLELTAERARAQIVRIDYERDAAERDFILSGFLDGSGPLGRIVLNEFRTARPRLAAWTREFQALVLAGELTVAQSVDLFLSKLTA